jgi:phospholipid/cholesterol/gamma-HCH transport system permease protein
MYGSRDSRHQRSLRKKARESTDLTNYLRDQVYSALVIFGGFFQMCILTGKALVCRPFHWREFVLQCWFVVRVAFLPTMMVSIPLTVLFIFSLNILLSQFGAASLSGVGAALGAVIQLGPVVTVLVVAGAGSTAICADLGARTIRGKSTSSRGWASIPLTGWWRPGWSPALSYRLCSMLW